MPEKLLTEKQSESISKKHSLIPYLPIFISLLLTLIVIVFLYFCFSLGRCRKNIESNESTESSEKKESTETSSSSNKTQLQKEDVVILPPYSYSGKIEEVVVSDQSVFNASEISVPTISISSESMMMVVNATSVKIWNDSTTILDTDLLTEILLGEQVTKLQEDQNRFKVKASNYTGWIDKDFLISAVDSDYFQSAYQDFEKIVVTPTQESFLYYYKDDKWYKLQVSYGTILPKLGIENDWIIVALPNTSKENNLVGLIKSTDVSIWREKTLDNISDIETLITEGQKFLFHQYLWGGTTSISGIDCSGLWYLVFKRLGYLIPRDAQEQSEFFKDYQVSKSLERGDLLYFGMNESNITHTAIYLGEEKILHSSVQPNSSGVMIGDLTDGGNMVTVVRLK